MSTVRDPSDKARQARRAGTVWSLCCVGGGAFLATAAHLAATNPTAGRAEKALAIAFGALSVLLVALSAADLYRARRTRGDAR